MSRTRIAAAALTLTALATLAACGGGRESTTGSVAEPTPTSVVGADDVTAGTSSGAGATVATTVATPAPTVAPVTAAAATPPPAATAAPTTSPATAPDIPGADDFDICSSVPPLDVINAQLTEPATQLVELERGPGFAICEANGGEVDNVQFQRLTDVTRELSIELANELGATVTDLSDPPGGFAYAGAAAVVIDGVEWTVQTITWDTIGDPDSPVAIERSAALLRAWLALMGITPGG